MRSDRKKLRWTCEPFSCNVLRDMYTNPLELHAIPSGLLGVQGQIQFEHIYSRLAEEAEIARLGVRCHQASKLVGSETAFLGYALNLELGGGRRDVRI